MPGVDAGIEHVDPHPMPVSRIAVVAGGGVAALVDAVQRPAGSRPSPGWERVRGFLYVVNAPIARQRSRPRRLHPHHGETAKPALRLRVVVRDTTSVGLREPCRFARDAVGRQVGWKDDDVLPCDRRRDLHERSRGRALSASRQHQCEAEHGGEDARHVADRRVPNGRRLSVEHDFGLQCGHLLAPSAGHVLIDDADRQAAGAHV
jgi:hypothetical protein